MMAMRRLPVSSGGSSRVGLSFSHEYMGSYVRFVFWWVECTSFQAAEGADGLEKVPRYLLSRVPSLLGPNLLSWPSLDFRFMNPKFDSHPKLD